MFQSLDSWLDYITQLCPSSIHLGLERIQPLAEAMGLTQFSPPVIVVGGTNGKGSCVRFLECAYLAAGFQVAAYTSPHLLHFNERLRINNECLDDVLWLSAFQRIEEERGELPLTFFEFTTLAALWLCQQRVLDVIILEVGMGGRLDAVNVVKNDLAIITSIDLDHQDYLGESRDVIAKEKAGIFKPGALAVCGDMNIPLCIFEEAEQRQLSLYALNRDYFYEVYEDSWVWMSTDHRYSQLPMPALPIQNAATSLMALDLLQKRLTVSRPAIQQALREARLPGRFECVATPLATLYLDVAHNPHAMIHLASQWAALQKKSPTKTRAVFAMLKDKDISSCIQIMSPFVDEWYVGGLRVERAASVAQIAEFIGAEGKKCYTFASITEALKTALAQSMLPDRILVFGSFYTVAEATELIHRLQLDETVITARQRLNVTPQMRHRIVGLLILIGLVSLFLPLLFSKKEPIDSIANLAKQVPEAPPMPKVNMRLQSPEVSTDAEASIQSPSEFSSTQTTVEASGDSVSNASQVPTPTPDITSSVSSATTAEMPPAENSTRTITSNASTPVANPPASESAATAAKASVPVSKKTGTANSLVNTLKSIEPSLKEAPQAWTIQVGSYANGSAAQLLVQKLRANGFEAYTRQATTPDGKRVTRVYVGPEFNQTMVKQTQQRLQREFRLSGVISKYTVN